jgi:hypothetical protein
MSKYIFFFILTLFSLVVSEPNQNFYIFLGFGQSNMEGAGQIEAEDIANIPDRYKMMPAVDQPSKGRVKQNWYTALPPLCREMNGLGVLDYFGRELVYNLPEHISVGVINVAIGGCSIDLFNEDIAQNYIANSPDWLKDISASYGNHPYNVLVETARKAQESGIIKGILLHQGESNNGDPNWPNNVKLIYDRLIKDLALDPNKVPLLVGEVVNADQGGSCAAHNIIIANVPNVIPNSYVISSSGLPQRGDGLHFTSPGYREFGKRYGAKMLEILNKN